MQGAESNRENSELMRLAGRRGSLREKELRRTRRNRFCARLQVFFLQSTRRCVFSPHMANEILRNMRLELGVTQKKMAGLFGVSVRTLQGWEDGREMSDCAKKLFEMAQTFFRVAPAEIDATDSIQIFPRGKKEKAK
jgi:DNA-binding XRE family transcriptional regulator